MEKYWLTILILLLGVGIAVDAVRRMRRARRDSIKMSLRPRREQETDPLTNSAAADDYGSEFPSGGARTSNKQIDPERIQRARNNYDFGSPAPSWSEKIAGKIAEHTGLGADAGFSGKSPENRIEPSLDMDPLVEDANPPESVTRSESANDTGDTEKLSVDAVTGPDSGEQILAGQSRFQTTESQKTRPGAVPPETVKPKGKPLVPEPVQTSLNLDDSVPMLMNTLEGDDGSAATEQAAGQGATADSVKTAPATTIGQSRQRSGPVDKTAQPEQSSPGTPPTAPSDVLVIHLQASGDRHFYGSDLLELILDNGMRFGAMDIFHRHAGEDGEGPILFSMANMIKPGTFDLRTFESFSTLGLSFFLTLPGADDNHMKAFDTMVGVARDMAARLPGELKDEQRSVLTRQTIEHYRERIRDFSRRQQLEKSQ